MILSGIEILNKIDHTIFITPFDEGQLNPNSYNLKLHHELLVYEEAVLDMKKENQVKKIVIPQDGYVLHPGELYLGRTVESTKAIGYVPMLEGRSSIARLGIMVHLTAGMGNVGSEGFWTLEISCVRPVKIYPDIAICQIYFQELRGEFKNYNGNGKYHNQDIQPSLIHRELN